MSSNQGTVQYGNNDSSVKSKESSPPLYSVKTRRVLRKIEKNPFPIKQYSWLGGHISTLLFGSIYFVLYFLKFTRIIGKWYWTAKITYWLSFIGVLVSYTVTVLTTFGKVTPSYHALLATLNFQNLILAIVWLVTRNSAFKLVPYYFVSILQMADRFKISIILQNEKIISEIIAFSELFIIIALTFDTLLFRGTSGFVLVIYGCFYWTRLNFSPFTQAYILKKLMLIDEKIMKKQKPSVQEKWQSFLKFLQYRRSVMEETISKKLDQEAEIVTAGDISRIKSKPLGDTTKNYQMKGQSPISPSELSKGVVIPTEYELETKKLQRENELKKKQEKLKESVSNEEKSS